MNLKLHHVCIQTECYHETLAFYRDTFGFEVVKEERGFHARDFNSWLQGAGIMLEVQTPKAGTRFLAWSKLNSGPVHLAFLVDDVRAAHDRVKRAGYNKFKRVNGSELYEIKGSLIFKVVAPEGTEIEVRENAELT